MAHSKFSPRSRETQRRIQAASVPHPSWRLTTGDARRDAARNDLGIDVREFWARLGL